MAADRSRAHSLRWSLVNDELLRIGCSVTWYDNPQTDSYRYHLTRLAPAFERLAFYDDEQTAMSMARLMISQHNYEGE